MSKEKNDAILLSEIIIEAMLSKKAEDVIRMDLREIPNRVCDCFVICSGNSLVQINSIRDAIIEEVRKALKEKPWHVEGIEKSEWLLLDYSNVVVHIFLESKRRFYNIEDLWADARIEKFSDELVK
ncbi:ribosome silencing factor [Bacteroidales bacterium OttesenSCG-928-K03]|nr:ribosome silencing factor [Odoribacter sp. OttesenSCG-928-L07]MDL2240151.1 ribosome silencing factor [Bacteroidales bacterium OttesenSCG-928-K22]MDL2242975.1 ribosome silencing factor [Bacteroidales bacterium OttesenSCG-928-K03]